MNRLLLCLGSVALLLSSTGCTSTLAQPFQNLKDQPITVYRLQNFEPPAQAATPTVGGLPIQIPPQIQQWLGGAAQMLPPGLLPPGLLPGGTPAPAASNVQRFHNFPILGTVQVLDKKQREEVFDVFGRESNFQTPRQTCQTLYAEFGFQFGQGSAPGMVGAPAGGGAMPADVLVSLSCDQVQMFNYGWPYGMKTGLGPDTTKRVVAIVQKAFGG